MTARQWANLTVIALVVTKHKKAKKPSHEEWVTKLCGCGHQSRWHVQDCDGKSTICIYETGDGEVCPCVTFNGTGVTSDRVAKPGNNITSAAPPDEASDVCTCGHKSYQHENYGGTLTGCEYYGGCPCEQFTPADEDSSDLGNSGTDSKETVGTVDWAQANPASAQILRDHYRRIPDADEAEAMAEKIGKTHIVDVAQKPGLLNGAVACRACGWRRTAPPRVQHNNDLFPEWIAQMQRAHAAYIALVGNEATK